MPPSVGKRELRAMHLSNNNQEQARVYALNAGHLGSWQIREIDVVLVTS